MSVVALFLKLPATEIDTRLLSSWKACMPLQCQHAELVRWARAATPWREAGPPNHHDAKVDSDNKELPLCSDAERRGS